MSASLRALLAGAALAALPVAATAQTTDSLPAPASASAITLEQAVALARRQGHDAESAQRTLEAARWRERAFDARFLPRLELTSDVANVDRSFTPITLESGATQFVRRSSTQRYMELGIVQPLPWTGGEVTLGSRLTRVEEFRNQATTETWQTTPLVVGIRQSFFRPRTLRWDRQDQDLALTVAERQYLESREEVATQTAVAFFDLYAAQVRLDNAATNVAVNDTLYTLNEGRYEVGKIGENDLLQSELALLNARAALDGARLQRDRAEATLRRLLRLPAGQPLTAATPPIAPSVEIDTAVAVTQALRNASALPQGELQVLRTKRQLAQARSDAGFHVDLEASVGFDQMAPAFSQVYDSPLEKQQLSLRVDVPLVQWGAGRAAVAAARADQERAEGQATARREQVEEEARFAARQLMQAQRQLAISAKADTVAAKRFEVAKNRYVIGRIGINDLYVAQNEKDAAVQSYVAALRGYWAAHYQLRRLTLYDFVERRELRGDEPM